MKPRDWLSRFEGRRERLAADLASLVGLESPSEDAASCFLSGRLDPRSPARTGCRGRDPPVPGTRRRPGRRCGKRRGRRPDPRAPRHGLGPGYARRVPVPGRRRPRFGAGRLRHEGGHRRRHGRHGGAGEGAGRRCDAAPRPGRGDRQRRFPGAHPRAGRPPAQRPRRSSRPSTAPPRSRARATGSSGSVFAAGPRTPVSTPTAGRRRWRSSRAASCSWSPSPTDPGRPPWPRRWRERRARPT